MKISLIQENLAKALLHINKAVSNRPNIPVLANVLLETEKGQLKLSATNLEIGVSSWIGASVAEEGSITVSAKLLADFVNSLKPGKIELIQQGQTLVVKSVDNTAEFFIIPADDFPTLPEVEGEASLDLNALQFADAIASTVFAAGTDESRPVLTGALLTAEKKELSVVALDGFRLSKKKLTLDNALPEAITEVVPAKALSEVEKLIKDTANEESRLKIYLMSNRNQMLFKLDDVELTTRLIEGKFPNYEDILPSEKLLTFKIKKSDFSDTLKVVSIFARNVVGNKARFKVDTTEEKLMLAANVIDLGNNESTVKVKNLEGDDFEAGFNVRFLSEMTNAIKSDDIIFESNGPTAPGVFLDPDDKDFIHVIMPMRLN